MLAGASRGWLSIAPHLQLDLPRLDHRPPRPQNPQLDHHRRRRADAAATRTPSTPARLLQPHPRTQPEQQPAAEPLRNKEHSYEESACLNRCQRWPTSTAQRSRYSLLAQAVSSPESLGQLRVRLIRPQVKTPRPKGARQPKSTRSAGRPMSHVSGIESEVASWLRKRITLRVSDGIATIAAFIRETATTPSGRTTGGRSSRARTKQATTSQAAVDDA